MGGGDCGHQLVTAALLRGLGDEDLGQDKSEAPIGGGTPIGGK